MSRVPVSLPFLSCWVDGSGKSRLAIQLASKHPIEIVSIDSAQVIAAWTSAPPSLRLKSAAPCRIT